MLGVVCLIIIVSARQHCGFDITTGLPSIHLAEINFEAFYSQKMAAHAATVGWPLRLSALQVTA